MSTPGVSTFRPDLEAELALIIAQELAISDNSPSFDQLRSIEVDCLSLLSIATHAEDVFAVRIPDPVLRGFVTLDDVAAYLEAVRSEGTGPSLDDGHSRDSGLGLPDGLGWDGGHSGLQGSSIEGESSSDDGPSLDSGPDPIQTRYRSDGRRPQSGQRVGLPDGPS